MSLSRIPRTLAAGALAVAITTVGLAGTTTSAEAAPQTSTHCGLTAPWTALVTIKLAKNVSLTYQKTAFAGESAWCITAKRKKVAKKSYLSLAFNDHPGVYTARKSIQRLLLVPDGEVGSAQVRIFTKKNGHTKTTWTSAKQLFG